jgi:very-short-patch-repair endonuclease
MRFLDAEDCRRIVWGRCESPIEQMLCTSMFIDLGMTVIPDGYPISDFVTEQPRQILFSQYRIGRYRVDFLVVVATRETYIPFAIECDGKHYHSSDEQQERDEERDDALREAGVREVYRFTGWQIVKRPAWVVGQVANLLRLFGVEPTPPQEFAAYRTLRDQFCYSRNKSRESRQIKGDDEEALAAIRRADATWM